MFVEFGDSGCRQIEVVGQKDQSTVASFVMEGDQPYSYWINILLPNTSLADDPVRDHVFVLRDVLLSDKLEGEILFRHADKRNMVQVHLTLYRSRE